MENSKHRPFERLLGNTAELRLIEYLLSRESVTFSMRELTHQMDISIETMDRLVDKLAKWDMLHVTEDIGSKPKSVKYSINRDSPLVKAVENFKNEVLAKREDFYCE